MALTPNPESSLALPQKSYARIPQVLEVPNLIQVQLESFEWFKTEGLAELLSEISPIKDFTGNKYELEFRAPGPFREGERVPASGAYVGSDGTEAHFLKGDTFPEGTWHKRYAHSFEEAKYSMDECRAKEITYAVPLYVSVVLDVKDTQEKKEQWIFMGDIPMMTPNGTFIINGAERVVVSQLVRSPGAYFTAERDLAADRDLTSAKLIPYRGAWLEFETSAKDVLTVKVDRKRKLHLTTLLRAVGLATDQELLETFADVDTGDHRFLRTTLDRDPLPEERDISFREDDLRAIWRAIFEGERRPDGTVAADPWWPERRGTPYNHDRAVRIARAQLEFYRRQRPGEPPSLGNALTLLQNMFFDRRRYDLGKVGRHKLNRRLGLDASLEQRVLRVEDLIALVKTLIKVNNGQDHADDIDHLGNRRVRAVGELVQNHMRMGLLRMERMVRERMTLIDPEGATPQALVNIRPVVAAVREFFGGSQLSQFMDQTNPLGELTHKRRLSALGPGGLSRERAGFDVRDVHHSHYGRICPIETPEGPNIGLLASLSTYARINPFGFIEAPYRRVFRVLPNTSDDLLGRTVVEDVRGENNRPIVSAGHQVTKAHLQRIKALPPQDIRVRPFVTTNPEDIVYLSADEEEKYVIAQANVPLNERGEFVPERVEVRKGERPTIESVDLVDYMDVSPMQIMSVSASLIPFLEHDDANRALMGSNMQRQAVPLLRPQAPLVGTGIEGRVARDSGQVVISLTDGVVSQVSGNLVAVRDPQGNEHVYPLTKFARTNQGTCFNQRPLVSKGDVVKAGDILADSSSTDHGELALGQNVLVAFMSWEGYNYEDAVIVSEAMVRDDRFTSIHIERYEMEARETKLGPEEITRDIPNVGEESLRDLDERGIIRVGAEVGPGDILVGKVTPKGETELTAEEKLLRAIFGEKSRDVKDTSLRVPHGERGKVIDVRILSKNNKDELPPGVNEAVRVWVAQTRKISVGDKMAGRHGNKGVISRILPIEDMPFLSDGTPVDIILNPIGVPSRMNLGQVLETHLGWAASTLGFRAQTPVFDGANDADIEDALSRAWFVYRSGAIDPTTVGAAHGVSRATQVDWGRVRAWLAERGYDFDRLFDDRLSGEATRACMRLWLAEEGVDAGSMDDTALRREVMRQHRMYRKAPPVLGKMVLYDGRTGVPFDQPVTVGHIYMMKLIHLVEDKIHARSTGPYSLITQQPLGGKAQFGGQRFGEMEVWALEAYSAAYNLQEVLTVKSDDVTGRVKTYEAIVKGEDISQPGVPESFNVLLKELQSLGLAVELRSDGEEPVALPEKPAEPVEAESTPGL